MKIINTKVRFIVNYNNDQHRIYSELLREYGFSFIIDRNNNVGYEYFNPHYGMIVVLEHEGEQAASFEPKILKLRDGKKWHSTLVPQIVDFHLPDRQDYTKFEWNWINETSHSGDILQHGIEILRRELYILLRVRPGTLTQS